MQPFVQLFKPFKTYYIYNKDKKHGMFLLSNFHLAASASIDAMSGCLFIFKLDSFLK